MPLMMGDWIRGTQGMRAEVKGVYIGLLVHQYDHGFLPSDFETLCLIEPEVGKVWDKLKCKFEEFEPGKLRNIKLENVRAFWNKQGKNGKKGGRPKEEKPETNPNNIPKENPNTNLHTDIDLDNEEILKGVNENLKYGISDTYLGDIRSHWKTIDFDFQVQKFFEKVRGSPTKYENYDGAALRLALQSQLRNAKPKTNGTFKTGIRQAGPQILGGENYQEPL
jgi:hypothetical protein